MTLKRLKSTVVKFNIKSHGRSDFRKLVTYKKQWHPPRGRGWTRDEKKKNFNEWFKRKKLSQKCVYIFWANHVCLYVGRTGKGVGRPTAQFEKYWFNKVTRIDVYNVAKTTETPKAECIAFHLFKPIHGKIKPAATKGSQKCPICKARKYISDELDKIASFK